MRECGQRTGRSLTERHGRGAGVLTIDLRTVLIDPDRSVSAADLAELTRYQDPASVATMIDEVAARGMIVVDATGAIRGTDRCRAFLRDVYAGQAEVLADYWSPAAVAALTPVLGDLVRAALAKAGLAVDPASAGDDRADYPLAGPGGGSALGATSPPAEPNGTPDAVLLLNRLSTMRYHRSDAHAAAWREAGLTAPEMIERQARGGPERDTIERRTTELAAAPYRSVDLPGLIFQLSAILRHRATSEV
jgi:hypothetical protein